MSPSSGAEADRERAEPGAWLLGGLLGQTRGAGVGREVGEKLSSPLKARRCWRPPGP